ncbi:MAG: biopolymer transporter ExbD [Bacteroidales bacterium]|nr:biopolymer transporter ExbD [Bacteroidales bacterium]
MAKKTPAINSSSTADIAFLLLCYFLMTTTMGSHFGLSRRLPPMPDPSQKVEDQKINRRNIIVVKINSADRILAGSEAIEISQLKDKIKEFLSNPTNDPNLPEREIQEIEGYSKGTYPVSKGVISLQNDRGTSYRAYIEVQNELVKAVNEIRDEFSMREFGVKYSALQDEAQQKVVRDCIPQNISEAEPKDVGKRR